PLAAGFVLLSAGRDFGAQTRPLAVYFLLLVAFLPAALLAAGVLTAWPALRPGRWAAAGPYALALNLTTLLNWVGYFQSLRLVSLEFGPLPVFAVRFWLLLGAACAWAGLDGFAGVPTAPDDWTFAALFGLLGIAAPLLCLQGAIYKMGPAVPTLLAAFHPAC